MIQKNDTWTTIIEPHDRFFDLGLRAVWQKRYLLWLFVKRDLTVQFKQTIFGFAWHFLSPLMSTLIYFIVFSRIAGIPTDGIPEPLFYLSGICLWNYYAGCLTKVQDTFARNADLFGKVYFPRLISPLSITISQLLNFSVQLLLFVVVYVVYAFAGVDVRPNGYLLLFPLLLLLVAGNALGIGLLFTSLTTKYRDLKNFFTVFVQLWMYATPVVYPLSVITNPTLHTLMSLNPLTPVFEAFKYAALGVGSFSWLWLAYSSLFTLLLLMASILLFNHKQKHFIDTI